MLRFASMSASRRLRILANSIHSPVLKPLCTDTNVSIGDVTIKLKKALNPELVPIKYISGELPQSVLTTLRWIMQKDKLGQDVFLIGSPGPLRRLLAMQYLELTNGEMEYLSLTRDTTEADLKQRREIHHGTAFYVDQCAVRAAVKGRILVLEGIEKAERNVLPVLNNLLENREMQLEDGRFLMAASRYDALLKEHTKEELDAWNLVRVSEDFRVIALGLPVPRYHGNPLDPPLRSRFQARDIQLLPYKDQLDLLQLSGPQVVKEKLIQLLSFAQTLQSSELSSVGLPDFPIHNLVKIVKILSDDPSHCVQDLVYALYPYNLILGTEGKNVVKDALKTFHLEKKNQVQEAINIERIEEKSDFQNPTSSVKLNKNGFPVSIDVPHGRKHPCSISHSMQKDNKFVMTQYHSNLLSAMLQSHAVSDFCLVGPKGCGKSVLVQQFAKLLGYRLEPVVLYQDMTSRDLLQQRITLGNGDTSWRPSPLVIAALEGHIAELDGLHRVNPGTLAVLQRLVHDRELQLYDGSRLLDENRYNALKQKLNLDDENMKEKGVYCIHPSFRVIGLAEPPVIGGAQAPWLNSEILSMFMFHNVIPLSKEQEAEVIYKMVPDAPKSAMDKVLNLTEKLRSSQDAAVSSVSSSLSTRQLLRIANRLSSHPTEQLEHAINKACLSRFLPKLAAAGLQKELIDAKIHIENNNIDNGRKLPTTSEVKNGSLKIGQTIVSVHNPDNQTKVPDVVFYDIPQHLNIMEDMLKDFALGEHLLLVGNQGVGKNKIVDRFLHLLNRPREYIQLHRDTTVQSLTLQPTVQDGIIVYEDSPLVRAVKFGHVLVVDEADKAPTHVTCILKTLVESGEMVLGDGRRIIKGDGSSSLPDNVIQAHPDFRMIALANRPGFPFLGNDFFAALGDIFSCHAVDNPDFKSEMAMLRQYGPSVPEEVLVKLVSAFGELRSRADQGLISYPYSTREVVNVVKHLQEYPDEGVASVVRNVFDFDSYHPEVKDVVLEVMHKHGIPVGTSSRNINLVTEIPLSAPVFLANWQIAEGEPGTGDIINCPVEERKLKVKGPRPLSTSKKDLDKIIDRSRVFTEQISHWDLPLYESSFVASVAVGPGNVRGDWIHALTVNPVTLLSSQRNEHTAVASDLFELFPTTYLSIQPQLKMAALGKHLNGQVILFDQESNVLLQIDPQNASVKFLSLGSVAENTKRKLTRHFSVKEQNKFQICSGFTHENWIVIYQEGSNKLDVVDIEEEVTQHMTFPFVIGQIHPFSRDLWLLGETGTDRKYFLGKPYPEAPVPCVLYPIINDEDYTESLWQSISTRRLTQDVLCSALGDNKRSRSNRLLTDKNSYANIALSQPDQLVNRSPVSLFSFPREFRKTREKQSQSKKSFDNDVLHFDLVPPVCLPTAGQVVRFIPDSFVPEKSKMESDVTSAPNMGYLEVVDVGRHTIRYLPLPGRRILSLYTRWSQVPLVMAHTSDEGLVTIDAAGQVRIWETGFKNLDNSLTEWKRLIGQDSQSKLQVNYSRESGLDVSAPKHGKVDESGNPHVGGNTWAGGTGGRDTAGLGGKGGPYRLDAGHDVHQLSDEEKDAVPDDVKKAAREMARRAFRERLREIQMSDYDAEMYESFSSRVRRQVQSLRVILDSLQAKNRERVWLRHQTSGELDDTKLIEGLAGERAIYKKRGEEEPELGAPQRLPKRLRFVVDVSGSMYRFNGLDGRLERMMEAACLVMEAFDKYDDKIKYDIVGHSGESPEINFVSDDSLPKNNRERLDIMKEMHAHAQYCMSGDFTLEATARAISKVSSFDADEHFVVVLSDANLARYGIPAEQFGNVLTRDSKVNAFAVFIGSLGNQADRLVKTLPSGHAFVCLDTKQLPLVLQQIFTSTLLNSKS